MSDNKNNDEGYSYQDLIDMADEKKNKKKKTDPKSKKSTKNNNISKRVEKSGDKGHSTRIKNKKVKVDRSKIKQNTLLHEFMQWKGMGMNDEICCRYTDINQQTLVNWKKRATEAILECDKNGTYYDDHKYYDYIRFKKIYDATCKEAVGSSIEALKALEKDVVVYLRDEDGELIYDEEGEKIVSKIARPGNVEAIKTSLRILDPEAFGTKQTIDINNNTENKVIMITQGSNIPYDDNGKVDNKKLENMKNDFLSELGNQQKGLNEFINNRSNEAEDD
jgi:hypothetical protein